MAATRPSGQRVVSGGFATEHEGWTDSIAVPIGAFADPSVPPPTVSVYGSRRYPWLSLPDGIEEEHD